MAKRKGSKAGGGATLTAALAIEDAGQCLRVLADLDTKHHGMEFRNRPDLLGMLGALHALYLDVNTGGIGKFIDQHEGRGFHETERWCQRIGATQARAYLREVAKLFPGGKVPVDDGARFEVSSNLTADASVASPDPFRLLDLKYRGAMDEMAAALRAHVTTQKDEFETVLAAPAQRDGSAERWEDLAPQALDAMMATLKQMQEEAKVKQALAESKGQPKLDTAKITAFVEALEALDHDAWIAVARQHLADPRKFNKAFEEVMSLHLDLGTGRMMPKAKFAKTFSDPVRVLRDRALFAVAKLPEQVQAAGQALPLRAAAHRATTAAIGAMTVHDWLVATQEGAGAVRLLYRPFQGVGPFE